VVIHRRERCTAALHRMFYNHLPGQSLRVWGMRSPECRQENREYILILIVHPEGDQVSPELIMIFNRPLWTPCVPASQLQKRPRQRE